MDISDHRRARGTIGLEESSSLQYRNTPEHYRAPSTSSRVDTRDTRRNLDGQNHAHFAFSSSESSSAAIYRDTPPPQYATYNAVQHQQQHPQLQSESQHITEDNNGNKTWAQIWADIEKGTFATRSNSITHQAGLSDPNQGYTERSDFRTGHTGAISSNTRGTRRDPGLLASLRKVLPVSLLAGAAASTAAAPHPSSISAPAASTHQNQPNTASTPHSDKTLSEYKDSMSLSLYKSTPVRLLAITILFFNTLLVIKVMADPMTPFSNVGHNGMNGANGQIRFGSSLEQRFPCVAATSHNDEMQAAPFSEAMSLGLTSIEVDTWLKNGTLLAGHELKNLSPGKTLKAVYLDPLFKMLERANEEGNSERLNDWESEDWKGVFPLAPKQEMMLMIDVKNEPEAIFKRTMQLLKPFIEKNYLTVFKDGKLVPGPLTIVGTGDTSISQVINQSPRYIFYDAPLVRLQYPITIEDGEDEDGNKINKTIEWSNEIAPIASSKWLWWTYYPDVKALKLFSDEAHKRGIKARWWGVARWPAYFRRALWDLQLRAEVDWLNADDLADVAAFLRSKQEAKALKLTSESRKEEDASRITDKQDEAE